MTQFAVTIARGWRAPLKNKLITFVFFHAIKVIITEAIIGK